MKTLEARSQEPEARSRRRHRSLFYWLLASGSWLLFSAAARGQGVNPQSLYGRDTTQSVYVRDSAVAVEKFALAERMEHLKEWDKSADVYMEILRSYQDRVVPSQIDSENKIYQYTSVTPAVQERLAKWPEQGLAVYRARYEAEATGLLEAANDDVAQLHKVFSLYFVTDAAKCAGIRMADLYLEGGEFAAAAWISDRLLAWHPSIDEERPKLMYRTALAYHLAGSDQPAQAMLTKLKDEFPQATGNVRGAQVTLAESLEKELAATRSKARDSAADSWPMAFGSPDRARVSAVTNFGGARLFGIDVEKPTVRTLPANQLRELEAQNKSQRQAGMMTGIFPVVDRGELFFQDNARIYAVSLESGTALPGWAETYDGDRNGRFALGTPVFPTPRGNQQTLTVTDDSVLAVMGQPDYLAMQFAGTYGRRDTTLVCLDRRNGKPRWVATPGRLPESVASLRGLDLLGSPLVIGDTVCVQARGGKGMQFEDAYVLAFDLVSGNFKWACYIASANSTSAIDGDINAALSQNTSHLAYASGRIYAMTNLGALAAIDAYDGTIVWLNIYPREGMVQGRNVNMMNWRVRNLRETAPTKPWSYNPVIVSQQRIFTLPADGQFVHIYDAGSGVEVKRIKVGDYGNCDAMLGVVDERIVLSSDSKVYCIDWQQYDSEASQQKNQAAVCWWFQPRRPGKPEDAIRGRGFVTRDSVLIPTDWQLVRVALRNGAVMEAYPPGPSTQWGDEEGPGNVLVSGDRLILAGPTSAGQMRVSVYTDLNLAMSKLDTAVAAAPDDPAPRLRYAEIMFVAGKIDLAIAKLDEAIGLVTAGAGTRDTATRDRVFNAALNFAQKLARDSRSESQDKASDLFDRAGATAATASQKVNYRLSRASFARQHLQPVEEVKLYQQILSDAEMRAVPVADANGDTTPVASLARRAIDDAMRRGGVKVYEAFEQEATNMLETAAAAGDAAQFQAVAEVYPNSTSAPKALLGAADLFEQAGDPRRAAQVLRQVYFSYPTLTDRPRVIESMARCYLLMPGRIDVAIARLTQGGKLPGKPSLTKPLVLPDGKKIENMTLAQAADALRQYRQQSSGRDLPDVNLPALEAARPAPGARRNEPRKPSAFLPESPKSAVEGVANLVVPAAPFARHDRIITFTPGVGVRVFAIGKADALVTCAAITQSPAEAAWIGSNILVWNEGEIACIAGESGQLLWRSGLKDVPQVEVVAQAGEPQRQADEVVPQQPRPQPGQIQVLNGEVLIVNGQRVIVQNRQMIVNGRVQVIGPNGALIAQQPEAAPRPAVEGFQQIRPLTDRVVIGTTHGRILALDLADGKPLWQIRPGDRGASHLLASDDFIATRVVDESGVVQLAVFDTFSGQNISRRTFTQEGGNLPLPVNLALSPDGRLVVLFQDRLAVKDLFSPDGIERLELDMINKPFDPSMPFAMSVGADQLQISGETIYVLSDNFQQIRLFSLLDGKPMKSGRTTAMYSAAERPTAPAMMRVIGSAIFVTSSREVRYRDPEKGHWEFLLDAATATRLRDLVVARGHVLVLTEFGGGRGAPQPNQPATSVRISAFSRATVETGAESGLYQFFSEISDNSGITKWQVVDGGFYYLSGDQKLHFLRGAGAPQKG